MLTNISENVTISGDDVVITTTNAAGFKPVLSGDGTGNGFTFAGSAENVILSNLVISNFSRGVYFEYADNNTLAACVIIDNTARGVEVGGTNNVIVGNAISNSGSQGIRVSYEADDCLIATNLVSGSTYDNIIIERADGSRIISNTVCNAAQSGIKLAGYSVAGEVVTNTVVSKNLAYDNARYGIEESLCIDNMLVNNTILSNTLGGMKLVEATNTRVQSNVFQANADTITALDLSSGDGTLVKENLFNLNNNGVNALIANALVIRNVFISNYASGVYMNSASATNVTITYNIFEEGQNANDYGKRGVMLWTDTTDVLIEGNVFRTLGRAIDMNNAEDITIRFNIFSNNTLSQATVNLDGTTTGVVIGTNNFTNSSTHISFNGTQLGVNIVAHNWYGTRDVSGHSLSGVTVTEWLLEPAQGDFAIPSVTLTIPAYTNTGFLSWTTTAISGDFTKYRIWRRSDSMDYSNYDGTTAPIQEITAFATNSTNDLPADGTYYYYMTVVDGDGNESWYSGPFETIVDSAAPVITTQPSVSVTATNGVLYGLSFDVTDADAGLSGIIAFTNGAVSSNFTAYTGSGSMTIDGVSVAGLDAVTNADVTLVFIDKAGNKVTATSFEVNNVDSDTTAPSAVTQTSPTPGTWVAGTFPLSGTVTDNESEVSALAIFTNAGLFDAPTLSGSGAGSRAYTSASLDTTTLANGTNYVVYYATNTGVVPEDAVFSNAILVDNAAPTVSSFSVAAISNGFLYAPSVTGSDAHAGVDKVVFFVSNDSVRYTNAYGTLTNFTLAGLEDRSGVQRYETNVGVMTIDSVGNASAVAYYTVTNTLDTPPAVADVGVSSPSYVARTITIDVSIEDADNDLMDLTLYAKKGTGSYEAIALSELTLPNGGAATLSSLTNGTYSFVWRVPMNVADGITLAAALSANGATSEGVDTDNVAIGSDVLAKYFAQPAAGNLAACKALNNPYKGEAEGVVIAGLPTGATIRVYTVSGVPVMSSAISVDATGRATWNPTGMAPGTYIVYVTDGAGTSRMLRVIIAR